MYKLFISVFVLAVFSFSANAQDYHLPKKSPRQVVKQNFSVSHVTVDYSRPAVKGREIFGGLVPFGKIWRLGANEASTIAFGQDVKINGKTVAAGKYALYAIPNESEWTMIINKGVENWGAYGYKEEDDVLRVNVPVIQIDFKIENFDIWFDDIQSDQLTTFLAWDKTMVMFSIEVANKEWEQKTIDKLQEKKAKKK